jgi:hypothetical protein
MTFRSRARPRRRLSLLGALGLAAAACASPVGAVRVDPEVAQRQLARSATTTGEPSWPTRNHLAEHGLLEAFETRPEAALAELHRAMVASGGDPDLLFALAELAFLHGQATTKSEYRLASIQVTMDVYGTLFPGTFARLVDALDDAPIRNPGATQDPEVVRIANNHQ